MNETNKISVVINTYNAEKYLQQVLDSVKDFDEVVVCDMESTDHTVEMHVRLLSSRLRTIGCWLWMLMKS